MKCLPICFGVNIKNNFPVFFGAFFKFLFYCQENDWPILAQEEYFIDPAIRQKNKEINISQVSKINDIPNLKSINISEKNKYIITKEETDSVLEKYSSKEEAWIRIMNEENIQLIDILDKKIKKILKEHKDLKYIIVWRYNESINKICKKYKLKMINMEMSGFRKPSYNFTLCYFQYENKFSDREFNYRYEKFMEEIKSKKIKMLTRDQLIKLMVSKKEIDNMKEEEYFTGFAMGLAKDYDTISTNSKTNNEIIEELSKFEKKKNILIRKHPANYNYVYEHENEFTLDNSISSIQFLSKCHRVVSSVSNTGLEALLFGKTSFILGEMPFKRFGYQSLEFNDEYIINICDLNFLIFGYFVPYEIALSKEYINFRDSNPSEIEIYEYHYNYIMNKYEKYLNSKRIKTIQDCWLEKRKKEKEMINRCYDAESELQKILNSKSWKMTSLFRKIRRIFIKK